MMVYCPGRRQLFDIWCTGKVQFERLETIMGANYRIEGSGTVVVIEVSRTGRHYCREFTVWRGHLDQWLLKPPPSGWLRCPICHRRPFILSRAS